MEQKDFDYKALLELLIETFEEYSSLGRVGPDFIMDIISSDDIDYISYSLSEKIPF